MNKKYLIEWHLAKVEEYKAHAAKSKILEQKEFYLSEVEYFKNEVEKLKKNNLS